MTAGGWDFPMNAQPKLYAYENYGNLRFRRHLLAQGQGVHEMGLVPPRASRPAVIFAADEIQPQKFPAMHTEITYWMLRPLARGRHFATDAVP